MKISFIKAVALNPEEAGRLATSMPNLFATMSKVYMENGGWYLDTKAGGMMSEDGVMGPIFMRSTMREIEEHPENALNRIFYRYHVIVRDVMKRAR